MKVAELFEEHKRSVFNVKGKMPEISYGNFHCGDYGLTSLEGSPKLIHGNFDCINNALSSLMGGPTVVRGTFNCSNNKLTSLEGVAESMENFYCRDNKLTSLQGIHKQIKHLKHIGSVASFLQNPIKSNVLGLLKIEGLCHVRLDEVAVSLIINEHLKGGRDIFACQEELIEAGYPEFAQL